MFLWIKALLENVLWNKKNAIGIQKNTDWDKAVGLFITHMLISYVPCIFKYLIYISYINKYQFSSVAQSCLTLCNPINHSTPGLPVRHQLPEFTQTHVRWVGDAIQPSHPLSSPSPPAPSPSQHQGLMSQLFSWGGQSIGVSALASVLPMNTLYVYIYINILYKTYICYFGISNFYYLMPPAISSCFKNWSNNHKFLSWTRPL